MILIVLPVVSILWGESVPGINVEAAVDLTRGAPPELASDALIRLANLDRLEKKRRIELLNQAFDLGAGASQNYKRRATAVQASGPAAFLQRAYAQNLDRMSLRLRAIVSNRSAPLSSRRLAARIPWFMTWADFIKCWENWRRNHLAPRKPQKESLESSWPGTGVSSPHQRK